MGRPYKPVVLPLKQVPTDVSIDADIRCPNCEQRYPALLGRIGLRFVFRCSDCRVRFYHHRPAAAAGQLI